MIKSNSMELKKTIDYWSDIDYLIVGILEDAERLTVKEFKGLTESEILENASLTNIENSDIKTRLAELCRHKIVQKEGEGKNGTYKIYDSEEFPSFSRRISARAN
jgi:hypothetical protein